MIKILMLQDYTYRIHSGNTTLHKGKTYEAYSYRDNHYKVKVEDREDDVLVPGDIVREVERVRPKPHKPITTGTIQADISTTQMLTHNLQHFSRPESDHYHAGKVDVWQFADENFSQIEVEGFHRINAIKYLTRYGKKGGYNRKDLEKAIVSIEKLLELYDKER